MKRSRKMSNFIITAVFVLIAPFFFSPAALAAPPKGTIIIMRDIDSNTYDPHKAYSLHASEVLYMLGDTLVNLGPDMKTVYPGVAESWEIKDGGKTYIFHIRKDITFHNGKPLTADDVVYTMKRWTDPKKKKAFAWRAGPVKAIRALDRYTVAYELTTPYNELLMQLSCHGGTILDKENVDKLGKDFGIKGFNGTGPFIWEKWTPRSEIVIKRNPAYKWGPEFYDNKGPAKVNKIIWRVVAEEGTRVAALKTAQADITQHVPYWAVNELETNPKIKITEHKPYGWTMYIGIKITRPFTNDIKVRQALGAAVNRKELSETMFFGHVNPADSYYNPEAIDFDSQILKIYPKFDPEKSKRLLDEAGWKMRSDGFRYKDGKKLSLQAYIFSTYMKTLEAVQNYLRKVGVEVKIQPFDATVVWSKLRTQEYDIYNMSYGYWSVGDALNLYFQSNNRPAPNRMMYNDPWTDEMLRKGRQEMDPKKRYEIYSQVQRKVHKACVWIPIYHQPMLVASTERINGLKTHGVFGCGVFKGLDLETTK